MPRAGSSRGRPRRRRPPGPASNDGRAGRSGTARTRTTARPTSSSAGRPAPQGMAAAPVPAPGGSPTPPPAPPSPTPIPTRDTPTDTDATPRRRRPRRRPDPAPTPTPTGTHADADRRTDPDADDGDPTPDADGGTDPDADGGTDAGSGDADRRRPLAARRAPVTVVGILTTDLGALEAGRTAFVQDATGGIAIYLDAAVVAALPRGTEVAVTGTTGSRFAQAVIRASRGGHRGRGHPGRPAALAVDTGAATELARRAAPRARRRDGRRDRRAQRRLGGDDRRRQRSGPDRHRAGGPRRPDAVERRDAPRRRPARTARQHRHRGVRLSAVRRRSGRSRDRASADAHADGRPDVDPDDRPDGAADPDAERRPRPRPARADRERLAVADGSASPTPTASRPRAGHRHLRWSGPCRSARPSTFAASSRPNRADSGRRRSWRSPTPPAGSSCDCPTTRRDRRAARCSMVHGALADPYGQLEIRPDRDRDPRRGHRRPAGRPGPRERRPRRIRRGPAGAAHGVVAERPTKASSGDITVVVETPDGARTKVAADAVSRAHLGLVRGRRHVSVHRDRRTAGEPQGRPRRLPDLAARPGRPRAGRQTPSPSPSGSPTPTPSPTKKSHGNGSPTPGPKGIRIRARDAVDRARARHRPTARSPSRASSRRRPPCSTRPVAGSSCRTRPGRSRCCSARTSPCRASAPGSRRPGRSGAPTARRACARRRSTSAARARHQSPLVLHAAPTDGQAWRLVSVRARVDDVKKLGDRWRAELVLGRCTDRGRRAARSRDPDRPRSSRAARRPSSGSCVAPTRARPTGVRRSCRAPPPTSGSRAAAADRRRRARPRAAAPGRPGDRRDHDRRRRDDGWSRHRRSHRRACSPSRPPTWRPREPRRPEVRVGGLVRDLRPDGFRLDDGTAVGTVVLAGAALDWLPLIEPGDAINVVGRVSTADAGPVVTVDDPGIDRARGRPPDRVERSGRLGGGDQDPIRLPRTSRTAEALQAGMAARSRRAPRAPARASGRCSSSRSRRCS